MAEKKHKPDNEYQAICNRDRVAKNNKPNGLLFSNEFKEVTKRLKRKDCRLDEVIEQDKPKQREEY